MQAPITVLTSEQPTERKARMQERLQTASANYSFFGGLDGSKRIPVEQVPCLSSSLWWPEAHPAARHLAP